MRVEAWNQTATTSATTGVAFGTEADWPVFDLARALDRCCDDRDLLQELAAMLLASVPDMLRQMELAIAAGDAVALSEHAHAFKGALSSLTEGSPYRLAKELEFAAKRGDLSNTPHLFAALEASVEQFQFALHQTFAAEGRP